MHSDITLHLAAARASDGASAASHAVPEPALAGGTPAPARRRGRVRMWWVQHRTAG